MNIAVTGASGDIGGSFLAFAATEASTKALVRRGTPLRVLQGTAPSRFDFQDGYTYETDILSDFIASDAVVHCAALLNTDSGLPDYIAVNALFTGLLAMTCTNVNQAPKFVYISSEMVYSLSDSEALSKLADNFVDFCKKQFTPDKSSHDLRILAKQFFDENRDFQYDQYNTYALTKYLGEMIVQSVPRAAVLRVTNAYGPDYDNPRLIPRLIVGRLTGHDVTYTKEKRDFVYSKDINTLINAVIAKDIVGVIDCKSGEMTDTEALRDTIMHLTPTAYGALTGREATPKKQLARNVKTAATQLADIIGNPMPFTEGLLVTLHHHKEQTYHEMSDMRAMEDFLLPGEHIVRYLKGSSAAYLCIVAGVDGIQKVRKVAMRDGVEGNGVAKVANEIHYYNHVARYEPDLAALYPRMLDSKIGDTFSSETIEYLDGPNYYEALQANELPFAAYEESIRRFIDTLCSRALQRCTSDKDAENSLNSYYLERALTRLQSIRGLIEVHDTITINGTQFTAPHIILTELLENKALRAFILPHLECFCFHGDLTFLNTVYLQQSNEIRLIDPRGYTGAWDPLYDFGKLKFTLSGFGEFIIGSQDMVKKDQDGYVIDFGCVAPSAQKLNDKMLDMLADSELFNEKIIKHEPHWRQRIALAEATHYLADIPFRLFTDDGTWSAIASYVVGTYYLNQAFEALQRAHMEA